MTVVVGAVAENSLWERHPLLTVVNLLFTTGMIGAGFLVSELRDQRGTGRLLVLSGLTLPLGYSNQWPYGPWPLYSAVFGYATNIFAAWALLRYPEQRLTGWRRQYMVTLTCWLTLVPLLMAFFSKPQWLLHGTVASGWWPPGWPNRRVFDDLFLSFTVGCGVLAAAGLLLLVRRLAGGSRRERAVRLPVVASGIIAALASVTVVTCTAVFGDSDEVLALEGMADLSIPVAFLVSLGQQRLLHLSGLVSGFDGTASTAYLLRDVLRLTLRDEDLDLLIWSEPDRRYLNVHGSAAEAPPGPRDDRTVKVVTGQNGRPLALLSTSASTTDDQGLTEAAVVMIRLTLEKFQLSRRLLVADYEARQNIVSNLHDGAQKELCGLLATLSQLRQADGPRFEELLEEAGSRAADAVKSLRDLAHGVYPQTLNHAGLAPAVQEASDQLDMLVRTRIPSERLPTAVEKCAYFFICEALTNTSKYAHAEQIEVTVSRNSDCITVVVHDDGIGGANQHGPGLARLRDRIEAHGGHLNVDSPTGHGTQLTARIPCV
ncbi:sensor histidine kinase [Streptomyces sp. HUAS TT7]|uniref:sensor histidine kinase n=1 Tax=Streptomyces sp. HUAS TT7 TaxID=3447507 RepID=UPI003F65E090